MMKNLKSNFIHHKLSNKPKPITDAVVFIFTLLLLTFFTYLLGVTLMVSNITTVMSIILTGVNVGVAYFTASYTHKSATYQKEAIIENKSRDLSSQAAKIYSHIIPTPIKVNNKHKKSMSYYPIIIGNESNEPVYKLLIVSSSSQRSYRYGSVLDYSNNIDFNHNRDPASFIYFRILMPGHNYQIILAHNDLQKGYEPAPLMFFTDSRGNTWLRDPQGYLRKFDTDPFNEYLISNVNFSVYLEKPPEKSFKSLKDIYIKYPVIKNK